MPFGVLSSSSFQLHAGQMLSCPPMLATICLIILGCLCQMATGQLLNSSNGQSVNVNETKPSFICRPFGNCEPCPEEALNQPFCQPFGNRRLMHCSNITSTLTSTKASGATAESAELSPASERAPPTLDLPSHGETPAWEACGRIVEQERADFWEFLACNVLFAVISLFVLFARSRRLQALQARQLAARIGLVTGGVLAR
jgi:hypothetical protein